MLNECSIMFIVKQRVNMLMTKEEEYVEKLMQENHDVIRKLARSYETRTSSSSHIAQTQELAIVVEVMDNIVLETVDETLGAL